MWQATWFIIVVGNIILQDRYIKAWRISMVMFDCLTRNEKHFERLLKLQNSNAAHSCIRDTHLSNLSNMWLQTGPPTSRGPPHPYKVKPFISFICYFKKHKCIEFD